MLGALVMMGAASGRKGIFDPGCYYGYGNGHSATGEMMNGVDIDGVQARS